MKNYLILKGDSEVNRIVSDNIDFVKSYCSENGFSYREIPDHSNEKSDQTQNTRNIDTIPLIGKFIGKCIVMSNENSLFAIQTELIEYSDLLIRAPLTPMNFESSRTGDICIDQNQNRSIRLADGKCLLIPKISNGYPVLPSEFGCMIALSENQVWRREGDGLLIRFLKQTVIESSLELTPDLFRLEEGV